MKHANDIEEEEKQKEIIEKYKEKMGIKDDQTKNSGSKSWTDTLKDALQKPYIYFAIAFMVFSPYLSNILKMIFDYVGGK